MSQGSRHCAFVYVGKAEAVRRAMRRARPSEDKALAFIAAGAAAGNLPSLAEISTHMGWRHPDSVVQFLRSLERDDRLPEGYGRALWTKPNRKPQLRRAASTGAAA